jgi:hypothetical protein
MLTAFEFNIVICFVIMTPNAPKTAVLAEVYDYLDSDEL